MKSDCPVIEMDESCASCGRPGVRVDTTAGEIIGEDGRATYAPDDELWLMVDHDQPIPGLLCCGCAP